MALASSQKTAFLWASLLFALSAFGVSTAVCEWLTSPQISGGIFPNDINGRVVEWLGGKISKNAVGNSVPTLNPLSVMGRITVLILILAGLTRIRAGQNNCLHQPSAVMTGLRRTTTIFVVATSWWLIRLIGEVVSGPADTFAIGIAPMWLAMSAAFVAWVWGQLVVGWAPTSQFTDRQRGRAAAFLLVSMIAWTCVSFWMNAALYQQLFIPHGDSAMYEEHLWNLWHGKGFRSYLDQGLFLGEHIQVIHLLLLPLHVLWPSHLLLELSESIALASCAIPIFLMTRRYTQSSWAGAVMGVAWLFYFPMNFLDIAIDQKTFRPIALGLPFLFWLIEFTERRQFGRAAICLLIALSAKEDMALITFPLLGVMAIQSLRRRGPGDAGRSAVWPLVAMSSGSLLYLIVAVLVVIPAFRGGEVVHYSRYFGDLGNSPGDLARTLISDPRKVIGQAFSVRSMLYGVVFLAPLAFLPLRRPLLLCAGIATFGMLSLLQFGSPADLPPVPYHHFHAPLLPVLFWAAISGLGVTSTVSEPSGGHKRLLDWTGFGISTSPLNKAWLVLSCCVATSVSGSLMPWGATFWSNDSAFGYRRLYVPDDRQQVERAAMVVEVLKLVPATARVASTDFIHTRLTHFERSYDYSKYLRAVNNYQPGVPSDTEYIVIDTRHPYSEIRTALAVPELNDGDEWELLPDTTHGAYLILRRRTEQLPTQ